MARLDDELRVRAQEVRRHRDLLAVREHEIRPAAEFLDEAEDVVPAPAVQSDDVVLQLVQDLVHLEGGENRLDQHRDLDRLRRDAELRFRVLEDVRPESRLEMVLQLGQIKVRSRAARFQRRMVVEQVQAEVDERARRLLAVDEHMLLVEMPAARPHEQRRDLCVQPILFAVRVREADRASDGVAQIDLALHDVVPRRRERVLAIRHEHFRAGVERVDDHLAVGWSGDLDATILQIRRDRGDAPLPIANLLRLRQEVGQLSGVDLTLTFCTGREQLSHPIAVAARQIGDELERRRREDAVVLGFECAADFDAAWGGLRRIRRHRECPHRGPGNSRVVRTCDRPHRERASCSFGSVAPPERNIAPDELRVKYIVS